MKKFVIGLAAALCVATPVLAEDPVTISVNEENKAAYQQKIDAYQKEAADIIAKADAQIAAANKLFDDTKAASEKAISDAQAQIAKAQIDAKTAQENFEKVKVETNATITAANERIQKASEDLKTKIATLQKEAAAAEK